MADELDGDVNDKLSLSDEVKNLGPSAAPSPSKTMNEEEVKTQIILPLLDRYGIRPDEISLEKSFKLRVGRHTLRVDTEEQVSTAQPRLDLLIARNGKNLFIIEAKREGHPLREEERDQAISYARLVHPIAPYAITTNGKETKIYDTVSKKELPQEDLKINGYEVTLPEDLYYEAQRLFLGYSSDNLKAFCSAQSERSLEALIGSEKNRSRKYIPELHTPRQPLVQRVEAFLSSEKPLFVILGDSGTGKTSSLCHLAQFLPSQGEHALFFKGINLESNLLEEIGKEFNWSFSGPESSPIEILKRVENLLGNRKLIIIFDAIDEWTYSQKVPSLTWLVTNISSRSLKIILSCKINAWGRFIEQRGTPTGIEKFIESASSPEGKSEESQYIQKPKAYPGYFLEPLETQELSEITERYRKFYSFYGAFESNFLREFHRNLFFLRVAFEVAENSSLEHIAPLYRELLSEYFRKLTKKTSDPQKARKQLQAVAEALFNNNTGSLDEYELEKMIALPPNATLMDELFEYNILERTDNDDSERVGFYFQGLRDYIIAFHVKKWHEISPESFSASVSSLQSDGIQQEVLQSFYRQCSEDRKRVLDNYLRCAAEIYLDFYSLVIRENFMSFRQSFAPYTNKEIGFVAEISLKENHFGFYGFRELTSETDERILFLPVDHPLRLTNDPLEAPLLPVYGVKDSHSFLSFAYDYHSIDIKSVVLNHEIFPQLEKIIGKGLLNENKSPEMASEMLAALVKKHERIFFRESSLSQKESLFPIIFRNIERALLRRNLEDHFREKRMDERLRQTSYTHRDNNGYSFDFSDEKWIRERVQDALMKQEDLKPKYKHMPFSELEARIHSCLSTFSRNETKIEKPVFPFVYFPRKTIIEMSPDELLDYSAQVFELFLETYQIVLEDNFPSFCQGFHLYSKMPVIYFLLFWGQLPDEAPMIDFVICENPQRNDNNKVIVCSREDLQYERPYWRYRNRNYKFVLSSHASLLDSFSYHRPMFSSVDMSPTDVLRKMVYTQIAREMLGALELLFKTYRIPLTQDFFSQNG